MRVFCSPKESSSSGSGAARAVLPGEGIIVGLGTVGGTGAKPVSGGRAGSDEATERPTAAVESSRVVAAGRNGGATGAGATGPGNG